MSKLQELVRGNAVAVGAIVTVILMLVIVMYTRVHTRHEITREFLNGYWEASKTFCAKSGLEQAQIYLKADKAYLLLDEGDRIVLNKCVDISLSPDMFNDTWRLEFAEPVDPLPQSCDLRVDMANGMLGVFCDDTLYLEAYKDNRATANVV